MKNVTQFNSAFLTGRGPFKCYLKYYYVAVPHFCECGEVTTTTITMNSPQLGI